MRYKWDMPPTLSMSVPSVFKRTLSAQKLTEASFDQEQLIKETNRDFAKKQGLS